MHAAYLLGALALLLIVSWRQGAGRKPSPAARVARLRCALRHKLRELLGTDLAKTVVRAQAVRLQRPEWDPVVLRESLELARSTSLSDQNTLHSSEARHRPPRQLPSGVVMSLALVGAVLALGLADDARAYEVLEGEKRLACEAALCLMATKQPHQCTHAITHYLSIKAKKPWKTFQMRQAFLSLCPKKTDAQGTTEATSRVGEGATPDEELTPEEIQAVLASLNEQKAQINADIKAKEAAMSECYGWKTAMFCQDEFNAVEASKSRLKQVDERIEKLQDLLAGG